MRHRETWRDEHLGVSYEIVVSHDGVWSWTVFVPAKALRTPNEWASIRSRIDVTRLDIVTLVERNLAGFFRRTETYVALGNVNDAKASYVAFGSTHELATAFIDLLKKDFPGLGDDATSPTTTSV